MARVQRIDNAILKRNHYHKPKREPRTIRCRILIVCEGSKTEPQYFNNFHKRQRGIAVYEIDTGGGGIATLRVVKEAIRLRNAAIDAKNPYDSVWAVFDRDGFNSDDFDNAIHSCESNHIGCAWSNEAFELWYILHFMSITRQTSRKCYANILSEAVNKSPKYRKKTPYKYQKSDIDNYKIMTQLGSQDLAIERAKQMKDNFDDEKYHKQNPRTTVCDLILLLEGKDEEFNRQIEEKCKCNCGK